MKPLELMKLWADLQNLFNDPKLSDEDKFMVGREVLAGLPPALTYTAAPYTRALVEKFIKTELEKYRGNTTTGAEAPKSPTQEVKAPVRSGKRQEKDRSKRVE